MKDGEGRQITRYLRTIADLPESISIYVRPTVVPASWGLQSDYGDGRGTDPGISPTVFSFLQYSFLCLLASYVRLNFFSLQFCSSEDIDCCGPMGGPSLGHRCRKQSPSHSMYSWSFYKHWATLWDLLSQEGCLLPSLSSCSPQALHQVETWPLASGTPQKRWLLSELLPASYSTTAVRYITHRCL